jgi:hypothetical protein
MHCNNACRLTHEASCTQLEGAEAQAHISVFALEQLAAQAARRTALEAAFTAAGLGALPRGRSAPAHVMLGNADVSQALQMLLNGPGAGVNLDAWSARYITAIVAKGTLQAFAPSHSCCSFLLTHRSLLLSPPARSRGKARQGCENVAEPCAAARSAGQDGRRDGRQLAGIRI